MDTIDRGYLGSKEMYRNFVDPQQLWKVVNLISQLVLSLLDLLENLGDSFPFSKLETLFDFLKYIGLFNVLFRVLFKVFLLL